MSIIKARTSGSQEHNYATNIDSRNMIYKQKNPENHFIMAFLTYTHQQRVKLQKRGDTTPPSHLPICSRQNIYAALQAS